MRWSISAGRIFGIEFRIHITFFFLLGFIFYVGFTQKGLDNAIVAVIFLCAVFACVLIHEIGHSLIAQHFEKEVKSITLLPIGGMATLEEIPEKPSQEIIMSNSAEEFVAGLISINIILAIFNLIPAFPMDGGRVLRGILAMKYDFVKATSIAVNIGQFISFFFIFLGVFFNLWLALIGLFLYIGAGGEKQHVMMQAVLRRILVKDVMRTDYVSLKPGDNLEKALEIIYHGFQDDFPVIGNQGIAGILTRDSILSAIHEKGKNVLVSEVMDSDFKKIEPSMILDDLRRHFNTTGKTAALVVENGKLKGILCLSGISRYLVIQSALSSKQ
jgi:Zn-dependent protease